MPLSIDDRSLLPFPVFCRAEYRDGQGYDQNVSANCSFPHFQVTVASVVSRLTLWPVKNCPRRASTSPQNGAIRPTKRYHCVMPLTIGGGPRASAGLDHTDPCEYHVGCRSTVHRATHRNHLAPQLTSIAMSGTDCSAFRRRFGPRAFSPAIRMGKQRRWT